MQFPLTESPPHNPHLTSNTETYPADRDCTAQIWALLPLEKLHHHEETPQSSRTHSEISNLKQPIQFLSVWMRPSFSVSKVKVIEKSSTLHTTSDSL